MAVLEYLYGQDALNKLKVPPGYKIELFASEKEFADLANPVQLSFDNKGRLWVATMPSYPHYKPGDTRPNDKLIILEDTDADGKADKQTTFADGLHFRLVLNLLPKGVCVSQGTNLVLLVDTNGDDKADVKEIILSGFDDHDTHHAHQCVYGGSLRARSTWGKVCSCIPMLRLPTVRYAGHQWWASTGLAPQRRQLERTAQLAIPNPWGIAFDEWGENFFAETSGPDVRWMMPGSSNPGMACNT